jgi:hypothetical protein
MIKLDFSDLQKNGFRINQFRLLHSMGSKEFSNAKNVYKSSGDIIGERKLVISYMIENNEIDFTFFYFSEKLMYLFITTTMLLLVFHNAEIVFPIISAFLSLTFYILAYRHKENFVLGDMGITLAESIYNCEIKEKFNF